MDEENQRVEENELNSEIEIYRKRETLKIGLSADDITRCSSFILVSFLLF